MDQFKIRKYKPDDFPFIVSSWSKSYKMMSYFAKKISSKIFFQWHPKIIENILAKPMTNALIAHSEEDPDHILGYMVYSAVRSPEQDTQEVVFQYLFIKREFQKLGIARNLIEHIQIKENDTLYFTHWTYPMDEILQKHTNLIYNPYLI